jgi:A/G-specific adenine glycosylase
MIEIDPAKITFFQDIILKWYKTSGRDFYWRNHHLSNYEYIIAEVLLQRTKAETVSKFYPAFIARFPSWDIIAKSPLNEIEDFLRPVGLYTQRAKRLQLLALEMVKRKSILPKERSELESIPFMGQYIANAVELVIFHKPSPLMDVNMSRVLERFFGERKLADIRYDPYLQELAYKIVAHNKSKHINWAILDFAALVCKPKPQCYACPISEQCLYYNSAK